MCTVCFKGHKYSETSVLAIFVLHVCYNFGGKSAVYRVIIQKILTSMDVIQVCFKISYKFSQFDEYDLDYIAVATCAKDNVDQAMMKQSCRDVYM